MSRALTQAERADYSDSHYPTQSPTALNRASTSTRCRACQATGGSPRRHPVGRSKRSVPRWLINRVNALTVMEKLQLLSPEEARSTDCTVRKEQQTTVDPRPAWSARTRRDSATRQMIMWHSEVSAYASIKVNKWIQRC